MEITGADGHVESVRTGQADPTLPVGPERLSALALNIASMKDAARQQEALRALMVQDGKIKPSIRNAAAVSVHKDQYLVSPEHKGGAPVQHELIFQLVQ